MSEEIWQKLPLGSKLPADYFPTLKLRHWRTATRDHGTLLVNIIQLFQMVTQSALSRVPFYIQVNCDRILDRHTSSPFTAVEGLLVLFETVWWAGSMDPQQFALPLQLHGNSFAMSSGQVPKLSAGYNEGGGGGQEAELNQQNMTSSSSVSSRLNPDEQSECPLEPVVHCHGKGKLDIKSRSCSLLTICRSEVIFPWMNPRTTGSEQSGNWFCSLSVPL